MSSVDPKPEPRESEHARPWLMLALVLALVALTVTAGRTALSPLTANPDPMDPVDTPTASAAVDQESAEIARPGGPSLVDAQPGTGVVVGRLIDRDTGLSVRDAGVSLLELGRRTISLPDGNFRFDGIAPGVYTLVIGPAEGYLPRSLELRVLHDGADIGITPLLPADPATLIVPEYGGILASCDRTELALATDAIVEPTAMQLTCVRKAEAFPAPAPSGRLPLAVVDASPAELALIHPARLRVSLPAQPRYAEGVVLDLLRLDMDRLIWTPTGTLRVDPGGATASGDVLALGTYLVAAPPFGTFIDRAGGAPAVTRLNTSARPAGEPSNALPEGAPLVYLSFDYSATDNTPIRVRTVNPRGDLLFESERRYSGDGRDDVPMVAEAGRWAEGDYVTSVYVDGASMGSIEWSIGGLSIMAEGADDGFRMDPGVVISPPMERAPPAKPPVLGCASPAAWFEYPVQPGDTLGGIAERTGTSVAVLMSANCLANDRISAGSLIKVPGIPYKKKPPAPPKNLPYATPSAGRGASDPSATGASGASENATRAPSAPLLKATRPPDPTLAPRPTAMLPLPNPGAPSGSSSRPDPPAASRSMPTSAPAAPPLRATQAPPAAPKETRPPDPTLAPRPRP